MMTLGQVMRRVGERGKLRDGHGDGPGREGDLNLHLSIRSATAVLRRETAKQISGRGWLDGLETT